MANPVAGKGRTARLLGELEKILAQRPSLNAVVRVTEYPGEGVVVARTAVEKGARIVAPQGGDGTVSEVASGLMGSETALAVLPSGTGNDLARSLGIPLDLEPAVGLLGKGRIAAIDVGIATFTPRPGRDVPGPAAVPEPASTIERRRVNDAEKVRGLRLPPNQRFFVNVAGCGFDAAVAERTNQGVGPLKGTAAYVGAVLSTLNRYRPAEFRIKAEGRLHKFRAMLCSVANSRTYGGGMRIAPEAILDDGKLDVVVVREAGRIEFLSAFPRVFRGSHLSHPKVLSFRASRIQIESSPPMPILIDGDVVGQTPARFDVRPLALKIVVPAGPNAALSEPPA
ncbi:MAG: diacylglycerol kinase family protein [Fimbriimonadaceae bacterium]